MIICLIGATATGKTDLALRLSQDAALDVVSVDSALVYQGLDIGTAKPSAALQKQLKHYLIDICQPTASYSAGLFCQDAKRCIKLIEQAGRTPLLVGGTMLYFQALQQGLSQLPSANLDLRAYLAEEAEKKGWLAMHQQLVKIDPCAAKWILPSDLQRIQRALEVYHLTGLPFSEAIERYRSPALPKNTYKNVLLVPKYRHQLHQRIAKRFETMMQQGLIEEVKHLLENKKLKPESPAYRTVGYRQVIDYLQGNCNKETMKDKILSATRQLAKRQLTWMRHRFKSATLVAIDYDEPKAWDASLKLLNQFIHQS